MKILIINQPSFNRGDESAHKALIRSLITIQGVQIKVLGLSSKMESFRQYDIKKKNVEYIYDPAPFLFSEKILYGGISHNCTLLWWFHPIFYRYMKIYKWADYVICAPGGICMGGFQNWNHLYHLKMAKEFNKPLAYFGRSLGPFPTQTQKNRAFKKTSIEMLKYFSYLSLRDKKSEKIVDDINIPYISTVDTAFLDSTLVTLPYEIKNILKNKRYMVFVPNYLLWHYMFKGKVSHNEIISFYIDIVSCIRKHYSDLSIVMLPQLFGGNEYAFNDVELFRELAEKISDEKLIVIPDCYSSDIQQSIIREAKFVVGARYHSIVFSINQAVPFISLSYEHKMIGLLDTLGMTKYCVGITDKLLAGKQEDIITQIDSLLSEDMPDIKRVREKAKEIAISGFEQLIKKMHNS